MLETVDLIIRIFRILRDIITHYLRKPFIGCLGKSSYLKQGVRIVGNPYRVKIANNVKVWHNSILAVGKGQIVIGDNSILGNGVILNASIGKISVGKNVLIAPYSKIFSYSHNLNENNEDLTNSYRIENVIIEDDVFIGAGVTILPGVILGRGCMVAAGAVVTKSVEPYTIVGGLPAKRIGEINNTSIKT